MRERHNFLWLNLIDRKNGGRSVQKIVDSWIFKHAKYKKIIWENSVLSKRIISWILNVELILNKSTFHFKRNFLNSIITQTNHIKKNLKFEKNYTKKIEIITALLLSGLVFKEYKDNFDFGLKELEKIVKVFFDSDGFPISRNPEELIHFARYLILSKECIRDAQQYIPEFLDEIIIKNLNCMKNILTPENKVPLFNGGTEEDLTEFNNFLKDLKYKPVIKKKIVGGVFSLNYKKNIIFFDMGEPPRKDFSKSYQSGPLSFEYYCDNEKIITNCGFGKYISPKAELLSRLTSAQSTVTLNDSSVTRFERNKLINSVFGNSIRNTFKIKTSSVHENKEIIEVIASHNGYEKTFGCIHERKIIFDKKKNKLIGQDKILKENDNKSQRYSLRFHLYPGLNAVKTMSGNSALIQLTKNKSLIFLVKDEKITLDKGIFLGRNKIIENTCLSISGNLVNECKVIQWEIRKKI